MKKYTCMCCGFRTFDDVFSGYEICDVCGFQDDFSAIQEPNNSVYAGGSSLSQYQKNILQAIPIDICEYKNYLRSNNWKPIEDSKVPYFPQWKMDEFISCYPEVDIHYFEKFVTN